MERKIDELEKKISELEKCVEYWKKEVLDLEQLTIRKLKNPFLEFEVHLCDHCNLNCRGCDHFSPLAREKYTDISSFRNDLSRISELFVDRVRSIHLLGGEPLLNNNIAEYLSISRNCFSSKTTEITIVTNGLLLSNMPDTFFASCRENQIGIKITKYPINFNYDVVFEKLKKENIDVSYYNNVNEIKTMYKVMLTKSQAMDVRRNFYKCTVANRCVMLKNGKLYPCTIIPNIEHFNEYFGENYDVCLNDYIDIYKAKNAEEILDFLHNPVPFCRFCNVEAKEYGIEWGRSQKQVDEWI